MTNAMVNQCGCITNLDTQRIELCKDHQEERDSNMEGQTIIDKDDKNYGKKYDGGKLRVDLLSPIALEKIAEVLTFGAKKYGDNNWRAGISWGRVLGALLRHTFAFIRGEDKDTETGLSHLAHCGCCIMFLLEYEVTHKEFDDRWNNDKKGESKWLLLK